MSYPVSETETTEVVAVPGTQFDVKKFIYKLIGFLPWIILSVLLAYSIAKIYLRYTPQVHRVSANLLIKDNQESSPENTILRGLGVMPGGKELQDQIDILESFELAEGVVDSLNLQFSIISQGRIASSLQYGKNAPVFFHTIKGDTTKLLPASFLILLSPDKFILQQGNIQTTYRYKDTFFLSGRRVVAERNEQIKTDNNWYKLNIADKRAVALSISTAITVTKLHEMSGILEIAMLDQSAQRAVDIINKLIEAFNTASVNDKKIVGNKASLFLADRVDGVSAELDELEIRAEAFKRDNKINDISSQGSFYLSEALEYDKKQSEQNGELELLSSLEKFIAGSKDYTDIIPSQYGLTEETLLSLITQYNQAVLNYQEQLKISTQKDPILGRLKNQLADIKSNILKNIESIRQGFLIKLNQASAKRKDFEGQFAAFPEKEREYLKLKRQIGVKEQLYLYLLQKKEETELSLVSTINDSRIIESAFDKGIVLPKTDQVIMFSLLIGVIIPIIVMLLLDFFNNKIADRKEIEQGTKVPILGELAFNTGLKNKIVHSTSRSSLAEQFRLIGTNLQYIAPDKICKAILVTSFMSGEGKSFVSINLASSLAAGSAKVLLIEMDLRKPKLVKYLDARVSLGFTDYIVNNISFDKLIAKTDSLPNVDIITCGPVPPNPTELLMHQRVKDLFEFAKENYNYIVIDSPPVGLVADVFLISKYVDVTLFILRHKYSYKTTIQYIERLYAEQKLNALNIVVNGITDNAGLGYGYGYGYAYGYGYGYHYGSGYYPDDPLPKKFKNFFRRKKDK
ncbi:MAG TPA: polysaccharide biosynthesis tyrosine autokinase [Panacibacter sp.]|nr:polysaccharide biosynthesis tyrosine autokinase [Panacibacter sp.]